MKIVDNRQLAPKTEFAQLNNGDVFEYGGIIHIKMRSIISELGSVVCNAVGLATGAGVRFNSNDIITPLVCRLVIDSI